MKNTLLFVFFILFPNIYPQVNFTYSYVEDASCKDINNNSVMCNLQILRVTEILDISSELEAMIDRYLFIKKTKNTKECYQDGFIIVEVVPDFLSGYTNYRIFDSLYAINDLSKNDSFRRNTGSVYKVSICLINKNNKCFQWRFKNCKLYYYSYKGQKILIPEYIPLRFNKVGSKEFVILESPDFEYSGKCDEYDYTLETFFVWGPLTVTEVRYKDIIWPAGTLPREMFE